MKLLFLSILMMVMAVQMIAHESWAGDKKDIEKEVMRLLDDYMNAFNRQDLVAWENTFHFSPLSACQWKDARFKCTGRDNSSGHGTLSGQHRLASQHLGSAGYHSFFRQQSACRYKVHTVPKGRIDYRFVRVALYPDPNGREMGRYRSLQFRGIIF